MPWSSKARSIARIFITKYVPKSEKVDYDVIRFIKSRPGVSGIIYCLSRKRVEELTSILLANDIKASAYHAG